MPQYKDVGKILKCLNDEIKLLDKIDALEQVVTFKWAVHIIENEPIVDAVEVVRCEKCKHFIQQYDTQTGRKLHYGICKFNSDKFHDEEVNCEHFCGYGERKDGAGE